MDTSLEKVEKLLTEWSFPELIQVFRENQIDETVFESLSTSDLKELIPQLGVRKKFALKYQQFLLDKATDSPPIIDEKQYATSDLTDTETNESVITKKSSDSFSSGTEGANVIFENLTEKYCYPLKATVGTPYVVTQYSTSPGEDLRKLLNKSVTGRQVLQADNLTPTLRNHLVSIIINEELRVHSDKRIPTARFVQLARHIKQLFPNESLATYYTPYQHLKGKYKRCAKGKLFDKYHNLRRCLRTSGILLGDSSNVNEETVHQDEIGAENAQEGENIDDLLLWLKNNYEPWPTVVENWQKTSKIRLKTYKDSQSTIFEYLKTYPALAKPLGYTLFELDFKSIFPQQEYNLYSKINEFSTKILQLAKKSKDTNVIKFITHFADNETEDGRNAIAFLTLPYLLQTSLVSTKKVKWRPSKIECQETFLLHVPTADELDATLERQRNKFMNKCDTLQPLPIVIGNFNNLICMISVDTFLYKVESVIKCLDVCFKMYHVLHAEYPSPSKHIWQLVQTHLYEIHDAEHDKNYISINTFLTQLKEN